MDSESAFREVMDALIDFKDGLTVQLSERFATVYKRFDLVDAKLLEHDKQFEVIDGRLSGLEFHYGSLDRRVGRIETRLEDVERRLPA